MPSTLRIPWIHRGWTPAKGVIPGGFQIADERREAKNQGRKERCIELKAAFQRRAPRDKKAFINEQRIKLDEKQQQKKE